MDFKERLLLLLAKKSAQITLVVVTILLLTFFLTDNIVMPLYTRQGSEKPIPNLIGLTWPEAAQAAAGKGFEVVAQPGKISGDVPAGSILEQMPIAGSLAKQKRKIRVTPAIAIEADRAPDLVGLNLRAAQFKCKTLGLVCGSGEISYRFSETVPKGTVIGQKPKPNSEIETGESVFITVSLGIRPASIAVPALVEQTLHDARALINESGLIVGKIVRKETDAFAAGTVIAQSIRTGEEVEPGTAIDLVVAVKRAKNDRQPKQAD
jgi:serine/threonine-protein kinase